MIVDSASERNAMLNNWPAVVLLMCVFPSFTSKLEMAVERR